LIDRKILPTLPGNSCNSAHSSTSSCWLKNSKSSNCYIRDNSVISYAIYVPAEAVVNFAEARPFESCQSSIKDRTLSTTVAQVSVMSFPNLHVPMLPKTPKNCSQLF